MEPVEEVCSQGTEVTRLDKAARQFTAEHVRLGLHVPVERKDLLKAVGSLAKNASR